MIKQRSENIFKIKFLCNFTGTLMSAVLLSWELNSSIVQNPQCERVRHYGAKRNLSRLSTIRIGYGLKNFQFIFFYLLKCDLIFIEYRTAMTVVVAAG